MLRHLPKLKRHSITASLPKPSRPRIVVSGIVTATIALAGTIGGLLVRRKNKKHRQGEGPQSLLRPDGSAPEPRMEKTSS